MYVGSHKFAGAAVKIEKVVDILDIENKVDILGREKCQGRSSNEGTIKIRKEIYIAACILCSSITQKMKLLDATMAALTLALIHSAAVVAVDVPVIGIISRENLIPNHENDGGYYVGASYIKWLESAGARSIAILANATDEEVDMIFPQINGLLMPGGRKSDTKAETRLYKLAKEANESGETFPIMGICWGFQRLPIIQHGPNHHDEFKVRLGLLLTCCITLPHV